MTVALIVRLPPRVITKVAVPGLPAASLSGPDVLATLTVAFAISTGGVLLLGVVVVVVVVVVC